MNWKYFPCLIFLCYNEINSMEGNKMKKLFTYGILASIFIGGCATTKTPEQSYKSLKNYSSKILVNYRDINGDYRDVNNSCYNIDGVEKKRQTISIIEKMYHPSGPVHKQGHK